MKQPNLVAPALRGPKPQPNRQDVAKQIAQLKNAIRINLIRAGALALNGKLDAAVNRQRYAEHQRQRLQALTTLASELSTLPAKPDQSRNPRKAATKTQIKRKTYPMWSDK